MQSAIKECFVAPGAKAMICAPGITVARQALRQRFGHRAVSGVILRSDPI
jgi:hypothetical protein